MNQSYATTGIKHTLAMLLMMAMEDENHQHLNIDYVATLATPPQVSLGSEAKWLRDLILLVDPKIYEQIRGLVNGGLAVPGGVVDRQLFDDTAKNISLILQGVSESYHAQYATASSDSLALWEGTYPHPSSWTLRETVGTLLA